MPEQDTTETYKRRSGSRPASVSVQTVVSVIAAVLPTLLWTYSIAQEHALTKQRSMQNAQHIADQEVRVRSVEQAAAVTAANIETATEAMRQIAYDVREIRKAQEDAR